MIQLFVDSLPGGIKAASGGTRSAITLDRPWQTDIVVDPSTCPFDTKQQLELAKFETEGGWRVLNNPYSPFSWHRLIVPKTCWAKDRVRSLGGGKKIAAALGIAKSIMGNEEHEFWLGVHVGSSAGQNIGHLHYHLLQPLKGAPPSNTEDPVVGHFKSSPLVLSEDYRYKVVAGGFRAGQFFIVPADNIIRFTEDEAVGLAIVLDRLITLCSRKFVSKQGLPPDYVIGMKFALSCMVYASYMPILNNWGFTEYLGLLESRPLILPWPHQESVRYLTEP